MKFKASTGIVLTLLLISMSTLAFNIQPIEASGTIYIRADGSIDPPITNITTVDNITYTFIGNINESIVVERNNIVVDGAGCTLQGTGSGTGIDLSDRNNVTIKNTEIKTFDRGIDLDGSSNNSIYGNNITNNWDGIRLWDSSHNSISGNNITANNNIGIGLELSSNNIISGNNITKTDMFGIPLWDSSHNSISGNNITNNGGGIGFYHSSNYNTLSGNNITNHRFGVWFGNSSHNSIYHNNFISNTRQVWTDNSKNLWDDSYPSGGNYWSDYTGVDAKSGPNQDQPSSDGLGDTPYVIDENNRDNYPLMYPWSSPPPPSYALTIYSSPTGVTLTVDGVSCTTPWSGTYSKDTSVNLIVPENLTVGNARYYWNQWSDGNTSRTRTVTMTTNTTLTTQYAGPYYELTVTSSPVTGIAFTINGTTQTTTYTEWLLEGSYMVEMPETYNGYVWSHWLEDGDLNRIKTITLPGTTYTAVYTLQPVGGTSVPIRSKPSSSSIASILLLISIAVASTIYLKHKKPEKKQKHSPIQSHE